MVEVYRALKASDITDDLVNKVEAVCSEHYCTAWVSPDLQENIVQQHLAHAWSPANRSCRPPDPAHLMPCPPCAIVIP